MEGIGDEGVAAKETDGADLSILGQARQADHRDIVQRAVGVNPLRDRVDLQVLRLGVEQDQVGLEMQGGVERAWAITFLPDQVLPAGLAGPSRLSPSDAARDRSAGCVWACSRD